MHIQNSIQIFKQYLKIMHTVRPRLPNPSIPLETPSIE